MAWTEIPAEAELARAGKVVIRHEGRQILVLRTPSGIFACTNRCPHEGYPLSEGVLTDGCTSPATGTTGNSTSRPTRRWSAAIG